MESPSCAVCVQRPEFLEPCPSCGCKNTYKHHSDIGVPQCRDCEPKICTECAYGARYTCEYFRIARELPPTPPKLQRQINEAHWEMAEQILQENPGLQEVEVERIPGKHLYVLIQEDGGLRRVSSSEVCPICEDVGIRREEHSAIYRRLGRFVCSVCVGKILGKK